MMKQTILNTGQKNKPRNGYYSAIKLDVSALCTSETSRVTENERVSQYGSVFNSKMHDRGKHPSDAWYCGGCYKCIKTWYCVFCMEGGLRIYTAYREA